MGIHHPSPHLTPKYQESPLIPLTIGGGEEQRIFYIHETLLTTASEYFKTALRSSFSEGQQKTYYLPEDDPCAFRAFVQKENTASKPHGRLAKGVSSSCGFFFTHNALRLGTSCSHQHSKNR